MLYGGWGYDEDGNWITQSDPYDNPNIDNEVHDLLEKDMFAEDGE